MFKRWVWIMAIGLVLAGGGWKLEAARLVFDLTKLKSVCVLADTGVDTSDFGLTKETIGNHVYVWLKGKLPKLQLERGTGTDTDTCVSGASNLWANVNLWSFREGAGYFGEVEIALQRETIWKTGNVGWGIAYFHAMSVKGSKATVRKHINEILDTILTDFAAEYYKAGNP